MAIASSIVSPCVMASGTSGNVTTNRRRPVRRELRGVFPSPFLSFQTSAFLMPCTGRLHFFLGVHRKDGLPVRRDTPQIASFLRAELHPRFSSAASVRRSSGPHIIQK